MHSEDDLRCPMEQSEQYFVALKRQGKEVEFGRFPSGSHGFFRNGHPKMREERFERTLEWYERYMADSGSFGRGQPTGHSQRGLPELALIICPYLRNNGRAMMEDELHSQQDGAYIVRFWPSW